MERKALLLSAIIVVSVLAGGVSTVSAEPYTDTTITISGEQVYNPVVDEGDGATDVGSDIILAGDDSTNATINSEVTLDKSPPEEIDTVTLWINGTTGTDYNFNVTVWGGNETADGTYGSADADTQELTSFVPSFATGAQTVSIPVTVTDQTNYTLEFVTNASDSDGVADNIQIDVDTSTTVSGVSSAGVTSVGYGNVTARSPPTSDTIYESNAEQFQWTEHISEGKQLDNRWSGLTANIPFERTEVVRVPSVEYTVNGSSSSLTPTFYDSNDTAVVTLESGDMTTPHPDISISTVGQKVTPINGSVDIVNEQDEGLKLDQPFAPTSTTGWFGLDLNQTPEPDRVYDTNVSTSVYRVGDDVIYPGVADGTYVRAQWTNFTSTVDSGYADIDVTNDGGEWQNATITNHSAPVWLNVTRGGWNPVTVSQEANSVSLTEITVDDGETDMAVTTDDGSTVTATVEDLEPGKEILVLDASTGDAIDQSKVSDAGVMEFNVVNSTSLKFRYGLQLDFGSFTVNPIIQEYKFIQGAQTTDNITVENNLATTQQINVSTDVDWIELEQDAVEVAAGGEEVIEYNVTSSGVLPGTHSGEITLEGEDSSGKVDVYLEVLPPSATGTFFGFTTEQVLLGGAVGVIVFGGLLYYYTTRREQASWSK